jgi:flagella basal body P-ring formation protein FlgA
MVAATAIAAAAGATTAGAAVASPPIEEVQPSATAPRDSLGATGGDWQDMAALEALVRASAERELPALREHERLAIGPISPGLKLKRCSAPMEPQIAPGLRTPARVLIEIRCASPSAWHVYVPARVIGTTRAVRAAHALVAGTVLTAADLSVEQHDVSELPTGYLEDPAIAIGKTASRAIAGGALLTNQQLLGAKAIQRGQSVTLIAGAAGISVRMPGRALSDGFVNQRVKVENISSGKIVEGIARSEQVVEIVLQ